MIPNLSSRPRRRRASGRTALAAVLIASLTSAGCAMWTDAPGEARKTEQRVALRNLGFVHTPDGEELNLAARLMFPVNDATLNGDDLATLTRVARILLDVGITQLTVQGHTDNQGGDDYNQALSERRAKVVAEALAGRGFAPANISQRGFGYSRPIADNATEAGRLQNRRAVLIVPSL